MTSSSRPPPNPTPPTTLFSRATATTSTAAFTTMRPWRSFFSVSSFTRPYSLGETTIRLKQNLSYFHVNYTLIVLLILFLSLLWHPVSLIVFLVLFVFWYFLYFSRDRPIVVVGREIDERFVLVVLTVVTIVALVLTGVWINVVSALAVSVVVVVLHAVFRRTEDLYLEEGDRGNEGMFSFVGSPTRGGYSRV